MGVFREGRRDARSMYVRRGGSKLFRIAASRADPGWTDEQKRTLILNVYRKQLLANKLMICR